MIPQSILKNVRRIEIRTKKLVDAMFGGEYQSVFKGQGIEFADVREYVPGDDVRSIDWNVTARSATSSAFIKKYVEERELTVVFLVDSSASTKFGSRDKMKSEAIAEVCAVLAFSAWKNNDKVGIISFTNQIEKYVAPRKGKSRILRVVRDILYPEIKGQGTDIKMALEFANRVLTRRAIIFLVSDFISADFSKPLRILGKKHDLVAIRVTDPLEEKIPNVGFLALQDTESGKTVHLNTGDGRWRKEYQASALKLNGELDKVFKSAQIDTINIQLGKDTIDPIVRFFKTREKRFR